MIQLFEDFINEAVLNKTNTVKFVHHVLDVMSDMCKDKQKNFGIKFDEIGGNLVANMWQHSTSLDELERNDYISRTSNGDEFYIVLWTTSENNGVPCNICAETNILIPNSKHMDASEYTDAEIQKSIKAAAEHLKKMAKLY